MSLNQSWIQRKGGRGSKSCRNERWEVLTHSDESFYNVAINILIFLIEWRPVNDRWSLTQVIGDFKTQSFSKYISCPEITGIGVVLVCSNKT